MAEIVIIPRTSNDLEVGAFRDTAGNPCVGLNFKMANGDHTVVTLSLPFFVAYADQLAHAAAQFSRDEYWRDVPK